MSSVVPLADPSRGYFAYKDEIRDAIDRVMESGSYILGPEVDAFEQSFATYCDRPYAVGVGSGTDALVLALRTLGIGPGSTVFTVSHTAVATVAAIELVGAKAVLVDIDPVSYTVDTLKLEKTLAAESTSDDTQPRAVIAVHIYGHPCNITALREICTEYKLALIEDCAQALGATFEGKPVGTFGDIAAFSFYPTKNLCAFGDGGAVVCADEKLASRCRALREYGWYDRYISELPGLNSRLDELQAAILNIRLRYIDDEIRLRQSIAARYDAGLHHLFNIPIVKSGCTHAYHLYVVRHKDRDIIRQKLLSEGILTGLHYPQPIHRQKAYVGRIGIGFGGLPVTESLYEEILSLPMFPFLTESEIRKILNSCKSCVTPRQAAP